MELKNFFAQDDQGNTLPGATCYLYERGTENLAVGLQAANGTALDNPFTADAAGLIQFAAPNGLYDLRVVQGARDYRVRVQCLDVDESVADAEAAAGRAEVARDAAQLSAGVFADTAAGLAGTVSGGYFSVPSAESAEHLVLYKNNAGAAQEVKRYPSTTAVEAVGGRVPHRPRRGWVHALRSAEGKLGLGINRYGRVIFGVGGDIVRRIEDLVVSVAANAIEIAAQKAVTPKRRGTSIFRVVDATRTKVALEVTRAGRLIAMGRDVLAELDVMALLRSVFVVKSGISRAALFAVRDAAGRAPLMVTRAGRLVAMGRDVLREVDGISIRMEDFLSNPALVSKFITPSKDLTLLGDSQMAGNGATTWRGKLMPLISARAFQNLAIGGQTSTHIAARFGSIYALLSVTGDVIPASGSVAVTACRVMGVGGVLVGGFTPLSDQGSQTLVGVLNGVPGTLSRAGDGSYTFTRTASGSAVNCAADTPFKPAWPDYDLNTMIVGLGRNNIADLPTIKRDIEYTVTAQRSAEKRVIILTVTNGGTQTPGEATSEGIGSTVGDNVVALEEWAESRFTGPGYVVLNVRKLLMPHHNGSADDLADVAAGTVPRSLRSDSVHYNEAAHSIIADAMANIINAKGW